jgi:hypothetical protein
MAKDDKLDAIIFGDPQSAPQNESLGELDDIFTLPIGPSKAVVDPKKPKTLVPELGLSPGEEKAVATGVGAVAGPIVQKGMEKLFPTQEMRTAEGIKNLQEQQRIKDALKAFQDEELLKLGI